MFPEKLNGNDQGLKTTLISAGRLKTLNTCFNMNEKDRGKQLMVQYGIPESHLFISQ